MKLFHIQLVCAIVIMGIIYYHTQHTYTLDRICTSDNILSDAEYDMVVHETNKLHHQLVNESTNTELLIRKKVEITKDSLLYHIFHGQSFIDKLNAILGIKLEPSPIRTLEYRTYDIGGHMEWHVDARVTTKQSAQIEVVYTIENTSDSTIVWRENDRNIEHTIMTTPNSVSITQGDSVFHKVTPVTYGKRSIIKASYEIIS